MKDNQSLKTYKRTGVDATTCSSLESEPSFISISKSTSSAQYLADMVFKLTAATTLAFAAAASAANIRRVTCPDGNVTARPMKLSVSSSVKETDQN